MTQRTKPVVGGTETTYAAIGEKLGITRQAAQQKYARCLELYGEVTWERLTQARHQDPEVAARKEKRLLDVAEQKIVSFALQHGLTHTEIRFNMNREDIQALVEAATGERIPERK